MSIRENTNRLTSMVSSGLLDPEATLHALLGFLSDDDVCEFAESEGYFYEVVEEEEDEVEDEEVDSDNEEVMSDSDNDTQ